MGEGHWAQRQDQVKIYPSRWDFGTPLSSVPRYESSALNTGTPGWKLGLLLSKEVVGPGSALQVLVVQNTPIKCLAPQQPLYPEAHSLESYFSCVCTELLNNV